VLEFLAQNELIKKSFMNWHPFRGSIVLLLWLVNARPALAQMGTIAQVNCQNATTTLEINECARQEFEAADKRLNQLYRQLLTRLQGSPKRQQFVNAQLAWSRYRDAACNFEKWDGGTGAGYSYTFCRARITRQRNADLESYLQK
jgi:uncharacterized protein YecT (DUF1311 family)